MRRRALFLLTIACAVLPLLAAPRAHAQDVRLPIDGRVRTGTLANGLQYYVRENSLPANRAELRLAVNVGSIVEDDTQRGLAHFVEHMAFNGTRNFPKAELVNYLESIGMRFGSHLNAYTSFDETVYMLQVPTDSAEALVKGLQILEDWAHGVSFDPVEIDKERGVVTEEWRLGQGAGERMRQQYFPVLFQNSRYAERLPIGSYEVLQSFPHEEAIRFYRDWYRPDLMAVIAVGDFDGDVVEAMIRDQFGDIPMPASPRERELFGVPDHAETLVSIATDREATGTSVQVEWKQPAQPTGTLAAYRAGVVRGIFTGMLNARLAEIAQKAEPPFLGAGSSYGNLIRTRDTYTMGAAVQNGGVERGLDAILTEAERVARHGFAETELDRQKTNLLRSYERAFAERGRSESAGYAAEYIRAYLEDESIPGIEYEYDLVQRLMPGTTIDEVNALAREWMTDRGRVVIVLAPQRDDVVLPTRESLLAVFDAVNAKQIEPYQDVVAAAELMADLPEPGRIVAANAVPGIDASLLELSNGVRVYLMPTAHKDDEVLIGAYSPGGLSLVPDSLYASGIFASALVQISGLADMDAVQLGKVLTGKVAQVTAGAGEYSESITGMASPQDLETALQLIHLHFTQPRSDTTAYGSFMSRIIASLANRDASPEAAFSDTFSTTLWQNHPRAQPQTQAFMQQIDQATSFDIYRGRFADAGDFTFAIVGAFDADAVRPLVELYLGSLPSTGRVEQPRDTGMRPVRGVVEKNVLRGVEPKSKTLITFTGAFDYNAMNQTELGLMVSVLDVRLRDVLREDMGGTYGVNISQSAQRLPEGRYSVSIAFGAAPERLDELVAAVFAEIEKLKQDGPAADVLANMKEQQRRAFESGLERNQYWLSILMREAETGNPAADALNHVQRVDAVTADNIRAAARRYLDFANYVRVSLRPESTM